MCYYTYTTFNGKVNYIFACVKEKEPLLLYHSIVFN